MAPNLQVHLLASIWMDVLFYGIYVPFFIAACYIYASKPTAQKTSSRIFMCTNTILFIFSSSHMIVNLVRLIRAYGFMLGPGGIPVAYFQTFKINSANYAHEVFATLIVWFAGFLFIYRLYLVWDRSLWVVPLPAFLHIWSLATSAAVLRWIKYRFTTFAKIDKWIDSMYPLAFVEYLIITVLIVIRLVRQSRIERSAGTPTSRGFGLFNRIFWDSAALWAILHFIQVPVYFKDHPGQFIVQSMILQSAGIIASILAVRVHMSHSTQVLADATHQALSSDNESQQEKRAGQV